MFAILIFERNPLQWADLPSAIWTWVQDVGALAAVALCIFGLAYAIRRPSWTLGDSWIRDTARLREDMAQGFRAERFWQLRLFKLCVIASAFMYALFFVFLAIEGVPPDEVVVNLKKLETWKFTAAQSWFLAAGGAFALLAVSLPVLLGLGRLSGRRIWAMARLTMKETIRQRVLWVFTALLLVVLFASWFLDTDKPEFQLRSYVWVVDFSMVVLLLTAAGLLAAFSIPGDVRSQTIHTVVTKPVERFEIVLGRFVGYTLLMTAVLAVVTLAGMLYLLRNINEEAKRENYKARVPIYGELTFQGPEAENSPREWSHRMYISGGSRTQAPVPNYAVWSFQDVPARLAERAEGVPCEFSFDIYRTHKGEEGKGIFCSFLAVTGNCRVEMRNNGRIELPDRPAITRRQKELEAEGKSIEAVADQLAEEFGFYQVPSQEVKNYHTQKIDLPAGLFKNALKQKEEEITLRSGKEETEAASLRIFVNVSDKSRGQLVGVAKHDLYLLDREKTFEENFIKGSIGLWFRLCLVIGIAVGCSTYLSGVISWLCTMFLFGVGLFKDQILQITLGAPGAGGGPMESMLKLAAGKPIAGQLDKTPQYQVALLVDDAYRWVMSYVLKLVPDVNRFDLSQYVLNGFDISWSVLLVDNLIPLLGYLVPWAILAYYLINSREIANPT
jgi:hypothetical protein